MGNDIPKSIFGECDVMSCAQHVEAKKLANKYYNQLSNTSDKIAECALNITEENTGIMMKKLEGLETKFNKINIELINFLRASSGGGKQRDGKCNNCVDKRMADEYIRIWTDIKL
jgi:hypothetical protein